MRFSTFSIERHSKSRCKISEIFAGKRVLDAMNGQLYHSIHPNNDIRALRINSEESYILKNNDVKRCSVKQNLEWNSRYELQVYGLSLTGSDESYIIVRGWLDDQISIEDSENVRINISNTNTSLNFEYKEYDGWNCSKIDEDNYCSYKKSYPSDSVISESFAPSTELIRIGFEDKMPEALEVIYG